MSSAPKTQLTARFLDPFTYLTLLSVVGVFACLVFSPIFMRSLVSKTIQVDPDIPEQLAPIQLKKEPIGALRIDVSAAIPDNHWVTYEIQLKDQQGQVIASGIKQAWRESGSWSEEGESGIWTEDDLVGGLDVRSTKSEPITIVLDVLEYSDISGKEIDQPVPFEISVVNGAVDTRYLWTGILGTAFLAFLALVVTPFSGKVVIDKLIGDSDISGRAILGGSNNLIRVSVNITADENSPRVLNVLVVINDGNGEQLYSDSHRIYLSFKKSESGKVTAAKGKLSTFFILESRSSYGFHVEVTPDSTIDRTALIVREHCKTLIPVSVTSLKSTQ
ncbi:MAG: hypothetical protein DCF22_08815 [Leptolyngbya sp.]|nr:MAG: hypothetical protein DCF22_08815 [Leptolyngbya sp.]